MLEKNLIHASTQQQVNEHKRAVNFQYTVAF